MLNLTSYYSDNNSDFGIEVSWLLVSVSKDTFAHWTLGCSESFTIAEDWGMNGELLWAILIPLQIGPGSYLDLWKSGREILAQIPSSQVPGFPGRRAEENLQRSLRCHRTDDTQKAGERTLFKEKMVCRSSAPRQGMQGWLCMSPDQQF